MARKILLADDSVTAQNMGRKILTDAGHEVVTVNNGSAALKKIAEAKPDLIVLDVYMPGYSGLEVCQRVKETRDTARIPVLLTVGKLEPFKQDEARRVRADAYIVKPFEASELLAALSKLEDKLTSSPTPAEENRFASGTMASFERFASESAPQYGDQESGWKARLTIPAAAPKLPEPGPEPEPIIGTGFRSLIAETPQPPSSVPPGASTFTMERPIPQGIPQDITADEIAAISAAAARINVGREFERLRSDSSSPTSELPASEKKAVTEATKTLLPAGEENATMTATPVETAAAASALPAQTGVQAQAAAIAPAGVSSSAESEPATTTQATPPAPAEFEAALLSLTPNVAMASPVASSQASAPASVPAGEAEPEPVTAAAAAAVGASEMASLPLGPRWIVEEVPLEADEAMLVLEREMHKVYAAFAAAEYAASSYGLAPVRNNEPGFSTIAPPPIGIPVPTTETPKAPAESEEPARPATARVPEPAYAIPVSTGFHEIPHPAGISNPPAAPFAAAESATLEECKHGIAAFGGPEPLSGPDPEPTPVSFLPSPEKGPAETSAESESRREAEINAATAAAWANWRDIRESIVNFKPTSQVAATAAGELDDIKDLEQLKEPKGLKEQSRASAEPESAALAAAASADGSAGTSDSGVIASIVDSMLAELRPKLVAEIAKKLEKKK